MTFAELCAMTAEEVNGRPLTFSSVALTGTNALVDPFQRRVVRAVQTVYLNVLNASRGWKFLNKRGKILSILAGKGEYLLPAIQSIEWDSLYLTKAGTSARWPVSQQSYNEWQQRERSVYTSAGIPLYFIRGNQPNSWLVWPIPNEAYQLNGNVQYKPEGFLLATDEPLWDNIYHEMLVWMAVAHLEARVKTQDEIVAKLNTVSAVAQATSLYNAFCAYYLPDVESARPLV